MAPYRAPEQGNSGCARPEIESLACRPGQKPQDIGNPAPATEQPSDMDHRLEITIPDTLIDEEPDAGFSGQSP